MLLHCVFCPAPPLACKLGLALVLASSVREVCFESCRVAEEVLQGLALVPASYRLSDHSVGEEVAVVVAVDLRLFV